MQLAINYKEFVKVIHGIIEIKKNTMGGHVDMKLWLMVLALGV